MTDDADLTPGDRRGAPGAARVRVVDHAQGLAAGEHLAWGYDDTEDWRDALVSFLDEGAERGELLLHLAWDTRPARTVIDAVIDDDLARLPRRDALLAEGSLRVLPSDTGGELADRLPALREEAVATGHRGLRISSEATALLLDRGPAHTAGFELACDRLSVDCGVTALCGFDRRRLAAASWSTAHLVHPVRRRHLPQGAPGAGRDAPDLCWLTSRGTDRPWQLTGDLDMTATPQLMTAAATLPGALDLHLDLDALRFVDTVGARALLHLASTREADTVLHHPSPLLRGMLEVMVPALHPGLVVGHDGPRLHLHAAPAERR